VKDMIANGSRQVVNGANLVRRQPSPAPVRKPYYHFKVFL